MVDKDDSFFTRNHIDVSFQMNYQLKKFDVGIKGGMPLSSLLNYQDASGALKQEKSWYLSLYFRVPILKLTGKTKN